MNLKNAFYLLVSLLFTGGIVLAQQGTTPPPAPPAPDELPGTFSLFVDGGSFLGVYAENITKENMARYNMREARGVVITQVAKDSPAEKAGLRKDDVILRFEGENVTSTRKLSRLVSEVAPDQTARLTLSRGGAEQEVTVTMGKRDNSFNVFRRGEGFEGFDKMEGLDKLKDLNKIMPPGKAWKWEGEGPENDGMIFAFGGNRRIGVTTTNLTKQLADYFGVADGKGVLITSVNDNSPAAKAGLKAGDVITAIDGEKVEGAGDVARGINKKKDGDVTLTIIRNKSQRTVNVTPMDAPSAPTGVIPGTRRIVIPRVEIGTIPETNVVIPAIELPAIPEINIQIPKTPKVKVIRASTDQPI
jgi:membrane-associated protease RseP (regulator of RpoE activity)